MILKVSSLEAHYDGVQALRGVDLEVGAGEMVALIGPNGAGKSTLLNCLSGLVAHRGEIVFDGRPLARMAPHRISRLGLLQVPEGRQMLSGMSVYENLVLGRLALSGRNETYDLSDIFRLFPVLEERRNQQAGTLSGGQQQMLAIGRALMGSPRMLLLDEPIVKGLFHALRSLNESGMTILLVEQNARLALAVSQRAYILERGRVAHHGRSREIASNSEVIEHYLAV